MSRTLLRNQSSLEGTNAGSQYRILSYLCPEFCNGNYNNMEIISKTGPRVLAPARCSWTTLCAYQHFLDAGICQQLCMAQLSCEASSKHAPWPTETIRSGYTAMSNTTPDSVFPRRRKPTFDQGAEHFLGDRCGRTPSASQILMAV